MKAGVSQEKTEPLSPQTTPFAQLGGTEGVFRLAERFYDAMESDEQELTKLHRLDENGKISRESRDRFALFLVGWLGGPQDYTAQHGHPRLRMRHHHVPIGTNMRDAWMRSMQTALNTEGVTGPLRAFLEERLFHVANFLRNQDGP